MQTRCLSAIQPLCSPPGTWQPDARLKSIAMENSLAETVFVVKEQDAHHIWWFNSTVDVCGHATLATAHSFFLIRAL